MPLLHYNQITLKKIKNNQFHDLDFLLKSELTYCINEIIANDSLLIDHYDSDNLHLMRVALRKMKSILRFFKHEISNKNLKLATSMISKLIKPTSKVRDFDVISSNYIIPACRENKTCKESLILLNQSSEKLANLHENAIKTLSSTQYRHLLEKFRAWINECKWKSNVSFKNIKGNELSALIENRLNERYIFINRQLRNIADLDHNTLHRIRINVKELRYLIEIFKLHIKKSKQYLYTLKMMQDNLGIINDTYIAEQIMNDLNTSDLGNNNKYIADLIANQRTRCIHNLSADI